MDDLVDRQFGEPVELHPWAEMSEDSISGEGSGPDPARSVISTVGVVVRPGARATGESGTIGAGLATQVVTQEIWVSIQEKYVGQIGQWHSYDRVRLPERYEQWYTIARIDPSATGRPNFHLIRLAQ